MSVHNLERVLNPKTVAVIGASRREQAAGAVLLRNLNGGAFRGRLIPVNPWADRLGGLPVSASVAALPRDVDLALIATPIGAAPQLVAECAAMGMAGAVIVSTGGREIGAAGQRTEAAIRDAAGPDFRIIGSGSAGFVNTRLGLNASFAHRAPLAGRIAFLSQSNAISSAIYDLAMRERIGFSYFISVGSMLDVDFADLIDFLGSDGQVSAILMYVETFQRVRQWMSAARSVSRIKPIISLKAGRTRAGTRAVASHIGTPTREDAVYDAAFKRAGILRVKTFEELFDCAELLARQPRTAGKGLAMITNAGGPGIMAADALSDHGVEPVDLNGETLTRLAAVLPTHWSRGNPIDILGSATAETYCQVVEICLEAREIDGLLLIFAPVGPADATDLAGRLVRLLAGRTTPVFTVWLGGTNVEQGRSVLNHAGITTFDTPERAVRAFMDLFHYGRNNEMLQAIPSRITRRLTYDRGAAQAIIDKGLSAGGHLTEIEAKALITAYGIPAVPTRLVADADAATAAADALGYPVAMKICSRQIPCKTDANGVRLAVGSPSAVRQAFDAMLDEAALRHPKAAVDGVTVQPMIRSGCELFLGARSDPDFGPILLFGTGGVYAEVMADLAIAFPPLNRLLARRLMEETRIYRLLAGYRHVPAANLALLEELLVRLGQLVSDFPQIAELEINPLMTPADEAWAADARVVLRPSSVPSPMHLVISPYPWQYESRMTGKGDRSLFIRPIRPEDAPLLIELFETLSQRSIYLRFFSPIKRLSQATLVRLTQIDYDRQIALVALHQDPDNEKMLAVGRVITAHNPKHAEFSIAVGDPWQGLGIGAALLQRCLEIARDHGIERVWGLVLAENTHMIALGRKLGFTVQRAGGAEYELTIDLTAATPAAEGTA